MSMTITEKIIAAHCGRDSVRPGDLVDATVDFALANDITAPLAIDEFEQAGGTRVFDPERIALVPDHYTPAKDVLSAEQARKLREFSRTSQPTSTRDPAGTSDLTNWAEASPIFRMTYSFISRGTAPRMPAVRKMLAAYRDHEDLISIGAYQRGSNPTVDIAVEMKDQIDAFLQQTTGDFATWEQTTSQLDQLLSDYTANTRQQAASANAAPPQAEQPITAPAGEQFAAETAVT